MKLLSDGPVKTLVTNSLPPHEGGALGLIRASLSEQSNPLS